MTPTSPTRRFRHLAVHCKLDPYDVYCGRGRDPRTGAANPGWGNPFVIGRDGDRDTVIAKHRAWLLAQPDLVARARRELRNKVLSCWCAPKACHCETLAEVANSG